MMCEVNETSVAFECDEDHKNCHYTQVSCTQEEASFTIECTEGEVNIFVVVVFFFKEVVALKLSGCVRPRFDGVGGVRSLKVVD